MEDLIRTEQEFRYSIVDPTCFFGRGALISEILDNPLKTWIVLGGRRIGKTSLLNAIEWNLIDHNKLHGIERPFPVVHNLYESQPKSLDHFRFVLMSKLRDPFQRWNTVSFPIQPIKNLYRSYISQVTSGEITFGFLEQVKVKLNISNPDYNQLLNEEEFRAALELTIDEIRRQTPFSGICFLLDGAEFIVRESWAVEAWNYLRSILDSKSSVKPYIGFILSGYRELKDYQQRVGSPLLNIAKEEYLCPLEESSAIELVKRRIELINYEHHKLNIGKTVNVSDSAINNLIDLTGCHPCLLQVVMDEIAESSLKGDKLSMESLSSILIYKHRNLFASWWNQRQEFGCLSENERQVYQVLTGCREANKKKLSALSGLSPLTVSESVNVLLATGVIRQVKKGVYILGSSLFEQWVKEVC